MYKVQSSLIFTQILSGYQEQIKSILLISNSVMDGKHCMDILIANYRDAQFLLTEFELFH